LRDQISDARSTVATLHRNKRVLVVAALAGMVAGAAYAVVAPPPLTSTTLVLLPTPAQAESSSSDVETQVQIALSSTVLDRAGHAVQPALSARSVKKMVAVTAANEPAHPDSSNIDQSGTGASGFPGSGGFLCRFTSVTLRVRSLPPHWRT
jgi:capsular polysaccharide biosynthesis protein